MTTAEFQTIAAAVCGEVIGDKGFEMSEGSLYHAELDNGSLRPAVNRQNKQLWKAAKARLQAELPGVYELKWVGTDLHISAEVSDPQGTRDASGRLLHPMDWPATYVYARGS